MRLKLLLISILITVFTILVKAETIHQWDVYTISFRTAKKYLNPYREIPSVKEGDLLTVIFTGTGGEALGQEIKITGVWIGGPVWHVNFAPPLSGKWKYVSHSADRSMNGKKGELEALAWDDEEKKVNPVRNGFVRVKKDGKMPGHYFEYSDGVPFLWIGDTWWNWTDSRIHMDSFKKLVDDRSAKGFNIGQLFVPGNGWGRESSLLDENYSVLDTVHASRVENMIKYANSKGITVWIHGWWSRPDLNTTIGDEKIRRWWRYLVQRFGAYNVVWVLAGEYNMNNYGGFKIDFWNELGTLIKNEDPYQRITSVHNTPPFWEGGVDAPQWSTSEVLHNEKWLDYNQSQVGHGKFANEMIPSVISDAYSMQPAKPVVVTESWYEFNEGNAPAMDIRFAAWSSILSGAAGHTYGGGHVWLASVPEAPAEGAPWPYEKGFARSTYDYQGAQSMKHLADFFKGVKWWNMTPHPELIKEYPQALCLADPGKEYVIYLRYGGTAKVEIEGTAEYQYQWFDPSNGIFTDKISVKGTGSLVFDSPGGYPQSPEYKDWVLYISSK